MLGRGQGAPPRGSVLRTAARLPLSREHKPHTFSIPNSPERAQTHQILAKSSHCSPLPQQGKGKESCSGTGTGEGNTLISHVIPQERLLCVSTTAAGSHVLCWQMRSCWERRKGWGSPTDASPAPPPRAGPFRTGGYTRTMPFENRSWICRLQTQLVPFIPVAATGL